MKKIYLLSISFAIAYSGFGQSVGNTQAKKGISDPILESFDLYKKKNTADVSRATNINRWISYDEAYTTYYASTAGLTRMSNGPIVNGTDVHMSYLSGGVTTVDTAFIHGAYSLIDLDGTWYKNTAFDPLVQPFAPNEPLTIDSVAVGFIYVKHSTVIDTVVVRIAVPSTTPNQMGSVFNYTSPNNTASGDTARWLGVRYDAATKQIVNTVSEVKIPLTNAFVSNPNNWRVSTDSTSFFVDAFAGDVITGHNGLLAIEVNVIHGKQLTSADTVGVNANWFAPVYLTMDPSGSGAPFYDRGDYTCGGVLYGSTYFGTATNNIFTSHWFGNSDNQVSTTGSRNAFQSAWVNLKITQNNTATLSIEENEKGATLFQNYPNPSNSLTTVKYELGNAANVTFEVMDVTGKKVISSNEGNKASGTHTIEINTAELNAGIYFYSIVVNGKMTTKKMTITK